MRFGFGRTLPHVLGTAIGMAALVVGVAAGIGALLDAVPAAEARPEGGRLGVPAVRRLSRLRGAAASDGRTSRTHSALWQGIAFQWVNPKAWVFTIAAVGAFLPPTLPRPVGVVLLSGILMVVVVGSSSAWAAGGAALGRFVEDERRRRAVSIVLAILLVVSIVLIWI